MLTPGRVCNYALGSIWLAGALVQIGMIRANLSYPNGWVYVVIMGTGSAIHFLMPTVLKE